MKNGRIIHEACFGFADITERRPVTRETVSYIASVTTPFHALGTLLQEADGRLDTGTSLQGKFPDLCFAGTDPARVGVADLHSHTARFGSK